MESSNIRPPDLDEIARREGYSTERVGDLVQDGGGGQEGGLLGGSWQGPGGRASQSYASITGGVNEDRNEEASQEGWSVQQRRRRPAAARLLADQEHRYEQGCYNCQEKGHLARDCKEPRQPKRCYNCQGNHLQRSCPNRRERATGQENQDGSNRTVPGGRGQLSERPEMRRAGGRVEDRRVERNMLTISLELEGNKMIPSDTQMGRICRRLGMKKEDVLGIAAKPYGMEVWMDQGVTVTSYLRENMMEVDGAMVKFVRQKGERSIRITIKGLPMELPDEVLLEYASCMGEIKRRTVFWERREVGTGDDWMAGKVTGVRSIMLTPKAGTDIPSKHNIGGHTVWMEAEGHRDCTHCWRPAKRCLKGGKKRECDESGVAKGDWRQRWLTYLRDAGTNEEEMREREQMSLKAGEVLIVADLEEEDCGEDPGEDTRLVGIEIQGMRGMTMKEPSASLEVKYMLFGLLDLEEGEKQDVLKLLDVKVQEDRVGRQAGGKRSKVVMKMVGKSDLLKKVWKGLTRPVKEYGGVMSFIQESEASTPVKDRSKGKEQTTQLEVARERARHEVKGLLSGNRVQELVQELQRVTVEANRLEEEMK